MVAYRYGAIPLRWDTVVGYVYIMTNTCMPGLVKVGWTAGDPEVRARKLSANTNVAVPFEVAWACEVKDPSIERLTHDALADYRENKKCEFFRCSVETA
jgi:hypothetical protein